MQTLFPTKILLPKIKWKRVQPKKELALSASEIYRRAVLKKANLPLDFQRDQKGAQSGQGFMYDSVRTTSNVCHGNVSEADLSFSP